MSASAVEQAVRTQYDRVARSTLSNDVAGVRAVAEAFGYSAEDLASIPAEANMGLSCGNPIALANLRPGEVVLDLGSGGGLDVFLASRKVGPAGKAIGVDMTPSMIDRARAAAAKDGITNVEFRLGTIDAIPVPDHSVDVVISNCVINLATDKSRVFAEIARVLKPGGRLAVSDIALKQPLPPGVQQSIAAYVGCIAGAIRIDDYRQGLLDAGLSHVQVIDSGADLNAYAKVENQSACCSPAMEQPQPTAACCSTSASKPAGVSLTVGKSSCCSSPVESKGVHEDLASLLSTFDVNAYAASVKVYAVK
jgi:SAM-dependent methyltransferase